MKPNVGSADKIIRIVAALILAALSLTGKVEGTLGIVFLVFAAVFLLTAFMNFCPLYLPFGLSTRKSKDKK